MTHGSDGKSPRNKSTVSHRSRAQSGYSEKSAGKLTTRPRDIAKMGYFNSYYNE